MTDKQFELFITHGHRGGGYNMASRKARNKKRGSKSSGRTNPVAKFGRKFNHGGAHRDRTKYWRKDKWREVDDQ